MTYVAHCFRNVRFYNISIINSRCAALLGVSQCQENLFIYRWCIYTDEIFIINAVTYFRARMENLIFLKISSSRKREGNNKKNLAIIIFRAGKCCFFRLRSYARSITCNSHITPTFDPSDTQCNKMQCNLSRTILSKYTEERCTTHGISLVIHARQSAT